MSAPRPAFESRDQYADVGRDLKRIAERAARIARELPQVAAMEAREAKAVLQFASNLSASAPARVTEPAVDVKHVAIVAFFSRPMSITRSGAAQLLAFCESLRLTGRWLGPIHVATDAPFEPAVQLIARIHQVHLIDIRAMLGTDSEGHMSLKILKLRVFTLLPADVQVVIYVDVDVIAFAPVQPLVAFVVDAFASGGDAVLTLEYARHLRARGEMYHGGFLGLHRRQSTTFLRVWESGYTTFRAGFTRDQQLLGEAWVRLVPLLRPAMQPRIVAPPIGLVFVCGRAVQPAHSTLARALPGPPALVHFSCTPCDGAADAAAAPPWSDCCAMYNAMVAPLVAAAERRIRAATAGEFRGAVYLARTNPKTTPILTAIFRAALPLLPASVNATNASIVWVVSQRCSPDLPNYASRQFLSSLHPGTAVGVLPGSCELFYDKSRFCALTRGLPAHLRERFAIECFVVPDHLPALVEAAQAHATRWFIVKRLVEASAIGTFLVGGGEILRVHSDSTALLNGEWSKLLAGGHPQSVVQQYLSDPFLIDQRKADLRVFVLVRLDPFRVYLHEDGWVWVSQTPFSMNTTDPFSHFTNRAGVASGEDAALRRRRRLAISDLAKAEGVRWGAYWDEVASSVAVHMHAIAGRVNCSTECHRFFNLLGVDVAMDRALSRARIYEINNDPGMHAYAELDPGVPREAKKMQMYEQIYGDVLRTVGASSLEPTFRLRTWQEELTHCGKFRLIYPLSSSCATSLALPAEPTAGIDIAAHSRTCA